SRYEKNPERKKNQLRAGREGSCFLSQAFFILYLFINFVSESLDILLWCETDNFSLVTNNRKTMPGHLKEHLGAYINF
ncbi:hypothetical protein QUF80_18670, partial [Desulfococcaceae bacterium HSG8]|nr:hypothetical protein [Desulfococcaceae bacterium HSG8]